MLVVCAAPFLPVTNVTVTTDSSMDVVVAWMMPQPANKSIMCDDTVYLYNLTISYNNCTTNFTQTYDVAPINTTTYTLTELAAHWSYNISILVVNDDLESLATPVVVSVTTPSTGRIRVCSYAVFVWHVHIYVFVLLLLYVCILPCFALSTRALFNIVHAFDCVVTVSKLAVEFLFEILFFF